MGGVFVGGVGGRFQLERGVLDVEVPGAASAAHADMHVRMRMQP
jgi:hypothetical protein